MKIVVKREVLNEKSTIGRLLIDGVEFCRTLEDKVRKGEKVYGETAIPEGVYKMELRTEGTIHEDYRKRFPAMHKGTLHILDIPGYKYVLIHIGNFPGDTLGCILVGLEYFGGDAIKQSTAAYMKIYPVIANALSSGEDVTIEVTSA